MAAARLPAAGGVEAQLWRQSGAPPVGRAGTRRPRRGTPGTCCGGGQRMGRGGSIYPRPPAKVGGPGHPRIPLTPFGAASPRPPSQPGAGRGAPLAHTCPHRAAHPRPHPPAPLTVPGGDPPSPPRMGAAVGKKGGSGAAPSPPGRPRRAAAANKGAGTGHRRPLPAAGAMRRGTPAGMLRRREGDGREGKKERKKGRAGGQARWRGARGGRGARSIRRAGSGEGGTPLCSYSLLIYRPAALSSLHGRASSRGSGGCSRSRLKRQEKKQEKKAERRRRRLAGGSGAQGAAGAGGLAARIPRAPPGPGAGEVPRGAHRAPPPPRVPVCARARGSGRAPGACGAAPALLGGGRPRKPPAPAPTPRSAPASAPLAKRPPEGPRATWLPGSQPRPPGSQPRARAEGDARSAARSVAAAPQEPELVPVILASG